MTGTLLVAGASGIVGRAALVHFARESDFRVVGLSRRRPDVDAGEHVCVDLTDRASSARILRELGEVTHVVYAALFEKPGLFPGWREADQMQTNLAMLRNCLEPIIDSAADLRHISLLQGTKAYGAHVRPMRVPGREREPRVAHENFYWLQEDWLRERQRGARFSFTIWRPPLIVGHAFGAPMNVLSVLGVYAAVQRAQGKPFSFPGGAVGPIDAVDARLLAEAFAWATDGIGRVNPAAVNETFNVTNGDVLVFRDVWPALAAAFGMEVGPDEPQRLAETLPARADVWDRVVARHGLVAPRLREFTGDSLLYADMLLGAGRTAPPPSSLLSSVKIRKAGFHACTDSEDMLVSWIRELQSARVLPPP
jgi:nucleoside-diphosphate-sugar epimerase